MRLPFNGLYICTQRFGANPQNYKQFLVKQPDGTTAPLKGHDGWDFGTPHRTEVVAPHDGEVLEVASDPSGYGLYIKIENDQEGSVLAHLDAQDVKVGYQVKAGEHLGWSDNTGNSTGPHLHWGWYPKPRNRGNGFGGFSDQAPVLAQVGIILIEGKLPEITASKDPSVIQPAALDGKGLDVTNIGSMQVAIDTWYDVAHGKYKTVEEYTALQQQIDELKKQLTNTQTADAGVSANLKNYNALVALGYNTVDDVSKALDKKDATNLALQQENTKLLKRIDVLAGEIQASAQEDHTTADLGQQAVDENKDLKDAVTEMGKTLAVDKITVPNILKKLFDVKSLADRFTKTLDEADKAKQDAQVPSDNLQVPATPSGWTSFLQLFKFIPDGKGGDKT